MRKRWIFFLLALLPVAAAVLCLGIGRYHVGVGETLEILLSALKGQSAASTAHSVICKVRLPRILLSLFVGAGLSVAGASFQSLFSNPLATPDTGVATGASFGAVLALLFSQNLLAVQTSAMVMGLAALLATTLISRVRGRSTVVMVVLAGMVVSALFQAMVSLIKYVADPEEVLPAITYWLMGSMSRASFHGIAMGVPLIVGGMAVLFLLRWRLNILSLQEDEAKSLGIDLRKLRLTVMAAATLITASCVSLCGNVGWVGLLIPHAARMVCGSDNKRIVPISMALGSAFMILIDTAARSVTAAEIPVSILTAIIGAPFFILLLRRTRGARL